MIIGKVVGSVVSTRKNENMVGQKLMVVKPLQGENKATLVASDNIGAGIGEIVLLACGSAARIACGNPNAPTDAAIVGIVDNECGLECI
jgi:ethanolamine utilization protein EutN